VIALICGVEIETGHCITTTAKERSSGEQSRGEERRGEERFSTNCGRILLAQPHTKDY